MAEKTRIFLLCRGQSELFEESWNSVGFRGNFGEGLYIIDVVFAVQPNETEVTILLIRK